MADRILLATDFSQPADAALETARRLLPPGGRLRLAHVLPWAGQYAFPGAADLAAFDVAHERLSKEARDALQARTRPLGERAEGAVLHGAVGPEIAKDAERWGADLLVVGARGHSRVANLLLGSAARSILRKASASILVVRRAPTGQGSPFHSVVVATDFYAPAERAARAAARIAPGARLTLVHAVDPAMWGSATITGVQPERAARDEVRRILGRMLEEFNGKHLDGRAKPALVRGRPVPALVKHLNADGADLLVVGTHGPGPLERFMLGSVAEGLAERAPCDVLVAR